MSTFGGPYVSGFWRGDEIAARLAGAAAEGVNAAAEHLAGTALAVTPLETGRLRGSQAVHHGSAGSPVAEVTYSAPYAVIVHEKPARRTTAGTMHKYLERPFNAERTAMLALVSAAVRRAMS